jgi:regulator of sigma E protease
MELNGASLIAFIFAMGLLVGWHEYGHYLAARLCGVKVVKFALGFGRPIFARKWGKDGTEWSLRWIPLGGFAMMLNEDDPNCQPIDPKDLPRAFNRQPLWKRSIIVAAGPLSNLLLAIILFAVVGMMGMKEPTPVLGKPTQHTIAAQVGTQAGDRIVNVDGQPVISWREAAQELQDGWLNQDAVKIVVLRQGKELTLSVPRPAGKIEAGTFNKVGFESQAKAVFLKEVAANSPAAKAGLLVNDELIAVDGQVLPLSRMTASPLMQQLFKKALQEQRPAVITVLRKGVKVDVKVTPRLDVNSGLILLGVMLEYDQEFVERKYTNPLQALDYGFRETLAGSKKTLGYVWGLVTAEVSLKTVGGMVTMAEISGKTVRAGANYFLHFLAWWSISLAIFNLLPIPFLDGGHLMYYGVEFLLRRKPSERFMLWSYRLGGFALLALMLLAHTNDAIRLLFN